MLCVYIVYFYLKLKKLVVEFGDASVGKNCIKPPIWVQDLRVEGVFTGL